MFLPEKKTIICKLLFLMKLKKVIVTEQNLSWSCLLVRAGVDQIPKSYLNLRFSSYIQTKTKIEPNCQKKVIFLI